jgi:hypothetical protein
MTIIEDAHAKIEKPAHVSIARSAYRKHTYDLSYGAVRPVRVKPLPAASRTLRR